MATLTNYDGLGSAVKGFAVTLVNADGTSKKVVLDNSAGTKAVRIEQLTVTSDDTSDRVISFWRLVSGTDYLVGSKNIPLASGTNGTVNRVECLQGDTTLGIGVIDTDGMNCLWLPAGQKLDVSAVVAVTAAKYIYISGVYREYL